jgi:hypothetical protein
MNTNIKIPMAKTSSLSDELIESTELFLAKGGEFTTVSDMNPVHEKLTYALALGDEKFLVIFNNSTMADLENAIGKMGEG